MAMASGQRPRFRCLKNERLDGERDQRTYLESTRIDQAGLRFASRVFLDPRVYAAAEEHARKEPQWANWTILPERCKPGAPELPRDRSASGLESYVRSQVCPDNSPSGALIVARPLLRTKRGKRKAPSPVVVSGLLQWVRMVVEGKVRLVFDARVGFGIVTLRRIKPRETIVQGQLEFGEVRGGYVGAKNGQLGSTTGPSSVAVSTLSPSLTHLYPVSVAAGPSRLSNGACGRCSNAMFSATFNLMAQAKGVPAKRMVTCCYSHVDEKVSVDIAAATNPYYPCLRCDK